jgi:DNA-binding transcriptional LysR family regulator
MTKMNYIHLRHLDLNLLIVFGAVMSERSVTQTGHRLHLTQEAVSHSSNRLRGITGDRLFVRAEGGCDLRRSRLRLPEVATVHRTEHLDVTNGI